MKQVIKFLLIISMLITACCGLIACNSADTDKTKEGVIYKRYKGEDFYTVYDYVDKNGVTNLEIPEKLDGIEVCRVNAGAFDGSSLEKIVLPNTITEIGKGAFMNMKKLKSLTVPFVGKNATADLFLNESVSSEDKSVDAARTISYFFGEEEYDLGLKITNNYNDSTSSTCYVPQTLTEIVINPKEAYSIPMYAFSGFTNLQKVVLNNVKAIGEASFKNCGALKTIVLPKEVEKIYNSAFASCTNLDVTNLFSEGAVLTYIGNNAFSKTTFTKITLPSTVVSIGEGCFAESELQEIKLSASLTQIGKEAFYKCSYLIKVDSSTVSAQKVKLGVFAFADCKKLNNAGITLADFDYTNSCFMDSAVNL